MSEENSEAKPARQRRTGLGRGLDSLFGEMDREEPLVVDSAEGRASSSDGPLDEGDALRSIPIGSIRPNPQQPRQHFDTDALAELAVSMEQRGVIQPIVVRLAERGDGYQIVAGERRWRAAQRARLDAIPAIVRRLNDEETLEIAIVENVQRRDLNAIEEAQGYARLRDEYGHDQATLAKLVGKSRSHVANLMRLLELPDGVRAMVGEGRLSMGHARSLVGVPDATGLANHIVERELTVRQAESLAKKAQGKDRSPPANAAQHGDGQEPGSNGADLRALEDHLADLLGLKVTVRLTGPAKGTMAIDFGNLDQLDLVCQRLTGERI